MVNWLKDLEVKKVAFCALFSVHGQKIISYGSKRVVFCALFMVKRLKGMEGWKDAILCSVHGQKIKRFGDKQGMIIVLCSWPDCLCFQPLQTFLGPHSYPPLIFFISLSSFLATPYLLFLLSVHHDSHLFDRILTVTLFSLSFPHHSYSHLVFLIFSTLLINIFPSFPHSITLFSISLSSSFLSFP